MLLSTSSPSSSVAPARAISALRFAACSCLRCWWLASKGKSGRVRGVTFPVSGISCPSRGRSIKVVLCWCLFAARGSNEHETMMRHR
eukprot:15481413-Alexandrium_andersonii.AAC.1